MKKTLSTLLPAFALVLGIGCGDNLAELPGSERDGEVLIIPHEGQALTALESAESAGFQDPIFFEDADIITAFGDMDLADEARNLPGIRDVIPAEEGMPYRPEKTPRYQLDNNLDDRELADLELQDVPDEAQSREGRVLLNTLWR